jgi:hypothetical protein
MKRGEWMQTIRVLLADLVQKRIGSLGVKGKERDSGEDPMCWR